MSKPVQTDTARPKETSLYLPAEVKAQIEALKIIPSETLVDVVRRVMADYVQRKEQPMGETVTLAMSNKSYARLQMVLRSESPELADSVARSRK
jgi:hypothetical protein